jgi:hypothetical protein
LEAGEVFIRLHRQPCGDSGVWSGFRACEPDRLGTLYL